MKVISLLTKGLSQGAKFLYDSSSDVGEAIWNDIKSVPDSISEPWDSEYQKKMREVETKYSKNSDNNTPTSSPN